MVTLEKERKIVEIEERCSCHGVPLKFYSPVDRKWCDLCFREEEEKNKKETTEKKIKFIDVELKNQIGEYAFDFDSKNYILPPGNTTREVIKKLSQPSQSIFNHNIKVFFHGGHRTGKTLTASLIMRSWARKKKTFYFLSLNDFKNLIFSDGFGQKKEAINKVKKSDVLVWDDVEYVRYNETLANEIKNILDYRFSLKKCLTIITSNKSPKIFSFGNFIANRLKEFYPVNFGNITYPYKQKT